MPFMHLGFLKTFTVRLLLSMAALHGVGAMASAAELIFEDGFEQGFYDKKKWKLHCDGAGALVEVVKPPVGTGGYAVHMRTTVSDRRAEIVPNPCKFPWGEEFWVGCRFLINTPVGGAGIFHQHHSVPGDENWKGCGAGPNSLCVVTKGKDILFLTATDEKYVDVTPRSNAAVGFAERTRFPSELNQWRDMVYHFRYAPDPSGYFQVWLDGRLVFDDKGSNVYRIDTCGKPKEPTQYLKIGIYGAGHGAVGDVYYDDLRVARGPDGYDLVSPKNNANTEPNG